MNGTQYIGLIGWNNNSTLLAKLLHQELRHTEVLAVATDHKEGQQYAREVLGLKHVYTEPHALYELHQLNAICINSSAEQHLDEVRQSLRSGTDVLIEQPLASNVSDCEDIEKLDKSFPSQKIVLAMPRRYDQHLIGMRQLVAEGALGHIVSIVVENYESYDAQRYAGSYPASKGIFMDITLQDIDMVRWLTGAEFTSVYATGTTVKYPSLAAHQDADTAHIAASTDKGFAVSFLSSRSSLKGDGYAVKLVGTKGEYSYDSRIAKSSGTNVFPKVPKPDGAAYQSMIRDFVGVVAGHRRLPHSVEVGTRATEVAVAMTKSFVLQEIIPI